MIFVRTWYYIERTQQNNTGFVALGRNKVLAGLIPVCCEAEQRRGDDPAFSNIESSIMRLREMQPETRLTISGKYTGEISLATQGKRPQMAAG